MADLASEANAVNGEEFDGTNAENLTNAFDQIYSSITSSAKIKVFSITDTLSQWVDPVEFSNATNGADITQYVTADERIYGHIQRRQFRQSHRDGDIQRY